MIDISFINRNVQLIVCSNILCNIWPGNDFENITTANISHSTVYPDSEVMPWQNSNMQWCHLVDKWFDQVAQMFASITAAQIICSHWVNGLFVKISSGCASYNFGVIDFNKD